jgi:hypothetical protein
MRDSVRAACTGGIKRRRWARTGDALVAAVAGGARAARGGGAVADGRSRSCVSMRVRRRGGTRCAAAARTGTRCACLALRPAGAAARRGGKAAAAARTAPRLGASPAPSTGSSAPRAAPEPAPPAASRYAANSLGERRASCRPRVIGCRAGGRARPSCAPQCLRSPDGVVQQQRHAGRGGGVRAVSRAAGRCTDAGRVRARLVARGRAAVCAPRGCCCAAARVCAGCRRASLRRALCSRRRHGCGRWRRHSH